MNYELPERDIWSHRKVSALVKALERNIEFLGSMERGPMKNLSAGYMA